MITLTRLSGSAFVLNSDLIERVDSTPDSVVTLVDGKKYVVAESLEEIIDAVRTYRAEVIAISSHLADLPLADDPLDHLDLPAERHSGRPLATVATLPTTQPTPLPLPTHGEA
ncbi:MAG TPA: flagellar FlbD family protein [Marmoricola sp.]|nr:flagellar FlbD family protein [Marmoricola sp.]